MTASPIAYRFTAQISEPRPTAQTKSGRLDRDSDSKPLVGRLSFQSCDWMQVHVCS